MIFQYICIYIFVVIIKSPLYNYSVFLLLFLSPQNAILEYFKIENFDNILKYGKKHNLTLNIVSCIAIFYISACEFIFISLFSIFHHDLNYLSSPILIFLYTCSFEFALMSYFRISEIVVYWHFNTIFAFLLPLLHLKFCFNHIY